MPVLGVIVGALRVKQWTKNLLLFAGAAVRREDRRRGRWADAWLAFAVYCAASSAAYLVNDVRDADLDRLHPRKRLRPVASGRLTAREGVWRWRPPWRLGALSGAVVLGAAAVVFVAGFIALQLVYSFGLKLVVGLDVLTIAALFTIRAAAGAEASGCESRPGCSCARRSSRSSSRSPNAEGSSTGSRRRSSARARSLLARAARPPAVVLVGLATIAAYSAYAVTARHSLEMAITIPFVAAAIARYFVLIHRDGLGEQPEEILVTDLPILFAIGSWAVTAGLVLTLT